MHTLWQDLRYGARMLLKHPSFTLVGIITLALGIGATTAIFSVVNAVLLRPLPYPKSEELMQLGRGFAGSEIVSDLSPQKFFFLRDHAQSFVALAATAEMGPNVTLTNEQQTEFVRGFWVTADFFRALGVAPAFGRGFTAEEDSPGGERVAILSDEFWRRRFGADATIIGKTITLNDRAHTVIGITPLGFEYFGVQDVFVPARFGQASENNGHNWTVIGRLKPGNTPEQARAELPTLYDRFRAQYPDKVDGKEFFGARRWRTNLTSNVSELLWVLLGAVGFVLLIACANVANLQLMRAAARRKELAIRLALGAGGWRLSRQLLTEGVLLALLGGGAGLLLAVWGLEVMLALLPADLLPRAGEIRIDGRVLTFALGASVLTGLLASLAPAWQALRADVNRNLKEGVNKTETTRGRLRGALVVVEVALALTLTIGAGLLLRTFANLRGVAPGFEARHALGFELTARGTQYDTMAKIHDLYGRTLERLRALPGVEAVAITNKLPLDRWFNLPYRVAGEKNKFSGSAEYRLISPAYFQVMKMTLQRGRAFNDGDVAGTEPVAIVNEAFARKHFAGGAPLGQPVFVCCERGDLTPRHIIGVVNETKQRALNQPAPPTVFIPLWQSAEEMKGYAQQVSFVLRTTGEPAALSAAVRNEVRQLDATLPFRNLRALDQLVERAVAPQWFNLSLLGLFAALGLMLAAVGIYGLLAYGVTQRTHEIGLRMALGAQARDVLRLVVKQGMALTLLGVTLGLLASWALTRLLKTLLFNVAATDLLTFAAVALLLTFVALLACWLPARRATKVDPLIALRCE